MSSSSTVQDHAQVGDIPQSLIASTSHPASHSLRLPPLVLPIYVFGVVVRRPPKAPPIPELSEAVRIFQPPDRAGILAFEGKGLGWPLNDGQTAYLKHCILAFFTVSDAGKEMIVDEDLSEINILREPAVCMEPHLGHRAKMVAECRLPFQNAKDRETAHFQVGEHLKKCLSCRLLCGRTSRRFIHTPMSQLVRNIVTARKLQRAALLNVH